MMKCSITCFSTLKFGLLFCRLLWSGFGELVSVMEHDPRCPMDNLYEQYGSRFLGTIGAELSREQKDVDKKNLDEAD
jgi:hypothetical protein